MYLYQIRFSLIVASTSAPIELDGVRPGCRRRSGLFVPKISTAASFGGCLHGGRCLVWRCSAVASPLGRAAPRHVRRCPATSTGVWGSATYGVSPVTATWWGYQPRRGVPHPSAVSPNGVSPAPATWWGPQPFHATSHPSAAVSLDRVQRPNQMTGGCWPAPSPYGPAAPLAYAYPPTSMTASSYGAPASYGAPYGGPSTKLVASSVILSGPSPRAFMRRLRLRILVRLTHRSTLRISSR